MVAKTVEEGKANGVTKEGYENVSTVEDILESLGGYSSYQRWMTLVLIFPQFTTAMIVLSPVFTGSSKEPMYCKKETYMHETSSCTVNCTFVDPSNITFTSIVQEWDLVCGQSWIVDLITSFQMAGMTIGSILSSMISDQFGRKKCFLFQTLCMGILGMLPALAFNPWSYALARFFAGFGVGACFVVYLSHLMEFLTPSWRTICGTISFFPFGEMFLGLVAYLIGSWRWLTVATGFPVLILLPFYRIVLESPRWLLMRKQTKEAHEVFATIGKWNSKKPPSLKVVEQLQGYIQKEESSTVHGFKAIKIIIANKTLRTHMAILILSNVTCAMVYYGLAFNAKNLSGSIHWNMFYMGIFDFLGGIASIYFNNKIGRKLTFMLYMGLGTVFMISLVIVDFTSGISESSALLVTILSLSGKFGIVAAWGALTCMILETAPTNLRSTCLGFCAFAGYLGGVVAPQLFLLRSVAESVPFIVLCVLTISSSVSSLFLRETLQQPLEDLVG